MTLERQLQHMYQAWQQGNHYYDVDWRIFVTFAHRHVRTLTVNELELLLKSFNWFRYTADKTIS